jgi:hypothetical protein
MSAARKRNPASSGPVPLRFRPVLWESAVRKLIATACLGFCIVFLAQGTAHAQQVDVFFGANTLTAPGASAANGSTSYFPQSLTGGFYPTLGGDVLFFHHMGVGGEVSWRGSRNFYGGLASQPFRPIFYDFNAVFEPPITKSVQLDLEAGLGAESVRFYQSTYSCNYYTGFCSNYFSSNHFLGHFSAGVKFYVWGNVFVRPQVGVYLVHNNYEFSSGRATQMGISIGYTLGHH